MVDYSMTVPSYGSSTKVLGPRFSVLRSSLTSGPFRQWRKNLWLKKIGSAWSAREKLCGICSSSIIAKAFIHPRMYRAWAGRSF